MPVRRSRSGASSALGGERAPPSRSKTAIASRLNHLADTITDEPSVMTSFTQSTKKSWWGGGAKNASQDGSKKTKKKKKGVLRRMFRSKKESDPATSSASSKVDSDQLVMDFFDMQSTVSETQAMGMLSGKKHAVRDPYENQSVTSQRSMGSFFVRFRQKKLQRDKQLVETTILADGSEDVDDELTLGSGLVSDAEGYVVREVPTIKEADYADGDFSAYAGHDGGKRGSKLFSRKERRGSSSSAASFSSDASSIVQSSSADALQLTPPVAAAPQKRRDSDSGTDSPTESEEVEMDEDEFRQMVRGSGSDKKGKKSTGLNGSQRSLISEGTNKSGSSGGSAATAATNKSGKSRGSLKIPHVPKSTIESLEALLPRHEAAMGKKEEKKLKKKKKKKSLDDSGHSRSSLKSSTSAKSSSKSVASARSSSSSKTPEERARAKARRKARKEKKAAKKSEEEEDDFVPIMGEAKQQDGRAPDRWSPSPTPVSEAGSPKRPARRLAAEGLKQDWRDKVYGAGKDGSSVDADSSLVDYDSDDDSESVFSLLSGLMATWVAEQAQEETKDEGRYPTTQRRSCLKQGGPVDPSKEALRVVFAKIEVREYERTVGDNPACGSGPPITIGWKYAPAVATDLEEYESKKVRRTKKQYYLPPSKRTNLLVQEWQCTEEQIRKARREATYIQYCREKTAFSKADKEAAFLRKAQKKKSSNSRSASRRSSPKSSSSSSSVSSVSSSNSNAGAPPRPRRGSDRQPKPTPAPLMSNEA